MNVTVQFAADTRRRATTEAVAARLEDHFRQHTVGDGNLDSTSVMVDVRRGGAVSFWAKITDDGPMAVMARLRAIAAMVESSAYLVDNVDQYRAAAHADGKLIGFVQGDFRGWLRDAVLTDLAEASR